MVGFHHLRIRYRLLCFGLAVAPAFAQVPSDGDPSTAWLRNGQSRVELWKTLHGLPQNRVNDVLQTRDGYLWIATASGLARFDGVKFKVFDSGNTPAFRHHVCRLLLEDENGVLWIGTKRGLIRYENGDFRQFGVEAPLKDANITALHVSSDGKMWIGFPGGVCSVSRAEQCYYPFEIAALPSVDTILEDRQGKLWVGGSSGLSVLDTVSSNYEPVWVHPGGDSKNELS
jgi:ligand-binding sensor domain-containing protein